MDMRGFFVSQEKANLEGAMTRRKREAKPRQFLPQMKTDENRLRNANRSLSVFICGNFLRVSFASSRLRGCFFGITD